MSNEQSWVDFKDKHPDADFTIRTKEGKALLVVKAEITAKGFTTHYEAFYNRSGESVELERNHSIQHVLYPCITRWEGRYVNWLKAQERKAKKGQAIDESEEDVE